MVVIAEKSQKYAAKASTKFRKKGENFQFFVRWILLMLLLTFDFESHLKLLGAFCSYKERWEQVICFFWKT